MIVVAFVVVIMAFVVVVVAFVVVIVAFVMVVAFVVVAVVVMAIVWRLWLCCLWLGRSVMAVIVVAFVVVTVVAMAVVVMAMVNWPFDAAFRVRTINFTICRTDCGTAVVRHATITARLPTVIAILHVSWTSCCYITGHCVSNCFHRVASSRCGQGQ